MQDVPGYSRAFQRGLCASGQIQEPLPATELQLEQSEVQEPLPATETQLEQCKFLPTCFLQVVCFMKIVVYFKPAPEIAFALVR